MIDSSSFSDNNISSIIPIFIRYMVIEDYLRKKFIGEIISKLDSKGKESKYAEILDIGLKKSEDQNFDIAISVRIKTLTFLYRDKEVEVLINAKLNFDSALQKISIQHFEIDSKGKNWLADQLLESVVNRFMYEKLKTKLNFDLMPQIQQQLETVNLKLENKFEAQKGLFVVGSLNKLEISNLEARDNGIWIFLSLVGWGVVEVEKMEV